MRMDDETGRLHILRRTAKEVRNYKVVMKILTTALVLILLLLSVLYVFAALYRHEGSFTVSLNKVDMTKYGLTLCESRDMRHQTSYLSAEIREDITNIAEEWLPENLDKIDGVHNGDNYVAYTFYLMNVGEAPVSYEYALSVTGITNDLDEAIRIRLYVDGVPTTYAKTASNGSGPEPGTTEFYSAALAAKDRINDLAVGGITKFTVVIWIEGNDPDCIDYLIGGQLKVAMNMSVVH